jgi:hypothetical protein
MGKASSAKKVARVARAGGSPSAPKRQLAFPLSILAIVVVGAVLVVVARGANQEAAAESPRVGEHWHAAYGIYVCDTFLPAGTDLGPDTTGLHTHNDGVAHLHPFVNGYAGRNATLGGFGEMVGLSFGSGSFTYLDTTYDDGYDCGGQPGEVSVHVWPADDPDAAATVVTDDMGSVRFDEDRLAVTIAVAPAGAEIPRPPSVPELDRLSDVPGGGVTSPVPEGADPDVEEAPATDTTAAPADGEGSNTTVAP